MFKHSSSIPADKGFTLVEMIVALGIFAVVAVIAVGALLRVVAANRQAQAIQTVTSDLDFSIESISRDIRVGSNFNCTVDPQDNDFRWSNHTSAQACSLTQTSGKSVLLIFKSYRIGVNSNGSGPSCRLMTAYKLTRGSPLNIARAAQQWCNQLDYSTPLASDLNPPPQPFSDYIPAETVITNFRLAVYPQPANSSQYSSVFLRLEGYSGRKAKDQVFFNIQTLSTQRLHD